MPVEQSVSVRFRVTAPLLAQAMAINAQERLPDLDTGRNFGEEDPRLSDHVRKMSRTEALRILRAHLWTYGAFLGSEDFPCNAYRAALERTKAWGYA